MTILVILLVLASTWPASAAEVRLSLEADGVVPQFGSACGIVTISGGLAGAGSVVLPSFACRTLGYELRFREHETAIWETLDIDFVEIPKIDFGTDTVVKIPFFLMKYGGRFLFGETGAYELRAVFRVRNGAQSLGSLKSPWAAITVVRHAQSESWRNIFLPRSYMMSLHEAWCSVDRIIEFEGTQYFTNHLLYQFGVSALRAREGADSQTVRLFRDAHGATIKGSMLEGYFYSRNDELSTNGRMVGKRMLYLGY